MLRKQFKALFSWLINNLGNIFSLLGIILTIYFSIFYVPTYVENAESEKISKANEELIETIEEIVYKELETDIADINTLIEGKNIKYKINYPYSVNQLLVQTQEDFMENKFIPLEDRKLVIERIDVIKDSIEGEPNVEKKGIEIEDIMTYLLSIFGVILGFFGGVSVYIKNSNAKEQEINLKVNEEVSSISGQIIAGYDFEKRIGEVLKEMGIKYECATNTNQEFDYIIYNEKGQKSIIEAKYYLNNRKIQQEIIRKLYHRTKSYDDIIKIILISNVELTSSAQLYADDVISKGDKEFVHILATSKEEIESGLKNNK